MLGHSIEFRRPDNGPIVDSDRGTANVQEMETLRSWMDETKVFGGSWWSCKFPGNNWILAHDNTHSRIYFYHMLKLNAWKHWTHSRMLNITSLNRPQTFFKCYGDGVEVFKYIPLYIADGLMDAQPSWQEALHPIHDGLDLGWGLVLRALREEG